MSLSDSDRAALSGAGTTSDPVVRRRAVAIALSKSGADLNEARELLAAGFTAATQPSFQYIPRGDSMAGEEEFDIAYLRAGGGASGAKATAELLGLSPGPDFALPQGSPTVVIESKVAEDGGTARDKASRIINLARAAEERGLLACAVIDGRGWSERANALADVVITTQGRTYSLATLHHLLDIPDIDALRGTAS